MSRLSPHGSGNKFNWMMREESGRDLKAPVVSRGVVVPSNVGRFKHRFNGRTATVTVSISTSAGAVWERRSLGLFSCIPLDLAVLVIIKASCNEQDGVEGNCKMLSLASWLCLITNVIRPLSGFRTCASLA